MKKSMALIFTLLFIVSSSLSAATPLHVDEVRQIIDAYYVDPVSQEILNLTTIEEMIKALNDPHTNYMSEEAYERYLNSIEQNFTGVGIHIEAISEGVLITNVLANSPAEKAGLLPGDIIGKVDGICVIGLPLEEVTPKIIGKKGTVVALEIKREDEVYIISITRDTVSVPYIHSELLDNDIGYIAINSFGWDLGQLFQLHIEGLKDLGAKSWVIDLRNNGGGYLQGALDLLGPLIGTEPAMQVKNKSSHQLYAASFSEIVVDDPVIVLVNRFSASASEIVSAALKDHKRAYIMGENTYGKGTVQSLIPLDHGGFLSLTTWRFFSPLGYPINGFGVAPHVDLETEHLINISQVLLGTGGSGYLLEDQDFVFDVNLELARTQSHWNSYGQFLRAINKEQIWPHYYPESRLVDHLEDVSADKLYQVEFNMAIDLNTVNDKSVQLKDAKTGENVPILFGFDKNMVYVKPLEDLVRGMEYWLTISDSVKSTTGKALNSPTITIVNITQ